MADLKMFATKENADDGVWIPVKLEGQKLPLALLIYGSDSDVVRDYERNRIRKLGLGKSKELDDEQIDELIESQDESIVVRIGGIKTYDWKKKNITDEPVMWGDKELTSDKKSIEFLIENIPAIKDFVSEKSNERSNFLSAGKKN